MTEPRSSRNLWPWLAIAVTLLLAVLLLRSQGRLWWCACGEFRLWSGAVWSQHNSQHLFDQYAFTHLLHGLLLYGLLAWAVPRLAPAWRFSLALFIQALWEVIENTDFVIQRYRETTMALGYEGDTVANSLGDVVAFTAGYVLARRLGLLGSAALFAVTEVVLLLWIRDSLFLNVLMLIYPIEAIKTWQLGA